MRRHVLALNVVRDPRMVTAVVIAGSLMLGYLAAVTTTPTLSLPIQSPIPLTAGLLTGIGVLAVVTLVGVRRPLALYAALLVSMPLLDLLRKTGTGDPRLVLVRDVLLIGATVSLTIRYQPWSEVRRGFAGHWWPLLLCIAYFATTGISSAFAGASIPISGFRLYFSYLLLIGFGWVVGKDPVLLRSVAKFGCAVLCAGTAIGIVQAVAGPNFLAASEAAQPLFGNLDLERITAGQSAPKVFQPSGPFAEPGRFANWSFLTLVAGVALVHVRSAGRWRFLVAPIGALGVFAHSGRTLILGSLLLVAIMLGRQFFRSGRNARRTFIRLAVVLAAVAITVSSIFPTLFTSRVQFVGLSLNPFSSSSEFATRAPGYGEFTARSVLIAGSFGRGLGSQSLGLAHLGASNTFATIGEGGFISVAIETGAIGLALWLLWTVRWTRLLWARSPDGSEVSGVATTLACGVTIIWFVNMLVGINAVQDFVTSAGAFFAIGLSRSLSQGTERIEHSLLTRPALTPAESLLA